MTLGSLLRPRTGRSPSTTSTASGPDEELLHRFIQAGDQVAFTHLIRRHGPAVYGVCRRILRDDHLAEDAFQNTFLVLARKARAIDRPAALAGWLYGVALRVALKSRPPNAALPLQEPETDPVDPSSRLITDELRLALDEEVARLPDSDRDLLVLVYLDGKTHDEAARAVGCPLGSVAWRLSKARDNLRRQLVRRGIELSVGAVLLLAFTGRAQAVSEGMIRRASAVTAPPKTSIATPIGSTRATRLRFLLPFVVAAILAVVGARLAFPPDDKQPVHAPLTSGPARDFVKPATVSISRNEACDTP